MKTIKQDLIIGVGILACFALLIGSIVYNNHRQYKKGYAAGQADYKAAVAKQTQQSVSKVKDTIQQSTQQGIQDEKTLSNANSALRDELSRLRQQLRTRQAGNRSPVGKSNDDLATQRGVLLNNCAERYAEVAERADSYRNDLYQWQEYGKAMSEAGEGK